MHHDTDFVVCPQCGSEYQPHVTHCIDCGAPTQSGWGHHDEMNPKASSLPPESEDFVVVKGGDLQWAENFGNFLEEHGIPWRIEVSDRSGPYRKPISCAVQVAEKDLYRAHELEQQYLLLENPALAAEFITLPSIEQCPACGSQVSPESSECQSCGLTLMTDRW